MMAMNTPAAQNINEYIASFPAEVQLMLEELRSTIKKAAPGAEESISYQMPAFRFNGILVYFAGYKNHIGFYPAGSAIENFRKEISGYKSSKGTVQFPLNQPLPLDLITQMVQFRVHENQEKALLKKSKKSPGKV